MSGAAIPFPSSTVTLAYNALRFCYFLYLAFGFGMYFKTDTMMEQYKVQDGSAMFKLFMQFFVKEFGYALFGVGSMIMAILSAGNEQMVYRLNRFFGFTAFGLLSVLTQSCHVMSCHVMLV